MFMISSNFIVCTPPPLLFAGEGVEPSTKFSKKGGGGSLIGPQRLEGGCWERGGDFFQEGACNCHIKNKLKSEIFNNKKSL